MATVALVLVAQCMGSKEKSFSVTSANSKRCARNQVWRELAALGDDIRAARLYHRNQLLGQEGAFG